MGACNVLSRRDQDGPSICLGLKGMNGQTEAPGVLAENGHSDAFRRMFVFIGARVVVRDEWCESGPL